MDPAVYSPVLGVPGELAVYSLFFLLKESAMDPAVYSLFFLGSRNPSRFRAAAFRAPFPPPHPRQP